MDKSELKNILKDIDIDKVKKLESLITATWTQNEANAVIYLINQLSKLLENIRGV